MSYSYINDPDAEKQIIEILTGIKQEVDSMPEKIWVEGVILGGGYGRGEGGVAPGGKLYNDLDLFVVPKDFSRVEQIRKAFEKSGHSWSGKSGIEVSYFIIPENKWLKDNQRTMMVSDLADGYAMVWGEPGELAKIDVDFSGIPWEEAARLMLNRGVGLLLCRNNDSGNEDFIVRNIHKAVAGCGDALLIANKQYCSGAYNRQKRVTEEPLKGFYSAAIQYKYQPNAADFADYPARLHEFDLLWLDTLQKLNSMRTGTESFSLKNVMKNILLAIKYYPEFPLFPVFESPRIKFLERLRVKISTRGALAGKKFLDIWGRVS